MGSTVSCSHGTVVSDDIVECSCASGGVAVVLLQDTRVSDGV